MAIGTAALGISALVINSVEALGGTMGKCFLVSNNVENPIYNVFDTFSFN